MSSQQSPRAEGRVFDLKTFLLGKLRAHRPLTALLEYPDSVGDTEGAKHVVLSPQLKPLRESDDPPDVVVAVDYVSGSSRHENLQERKNHNPQLVIEFRDRALSNLGSAWADRVGDEAKACVTRHEKGWYDPYVSGGSDLQWRGDLGRWQTVISLRISHWG